MCYFSVASRVGNLSMLSSYLVADHIVPLGAYTEGNKYFETFLKIYRSNSIEVREHFD